MGLLKTDTHAFGTALKIRIDIPQEFKINSLKMRLLLQIFKWCLGYYMWQDNKYVIVLSTLRTDVSFEKARARKRKYGREEEVIKPKLIFQIIIMACLALIERIEGCQAFRRLSVRRLQENVFFLN